MSENKHTITTEFKADTSNFTASTQQLNRSVKLINAEFKNATASLGNWKDSADGLKAKITQLDGVLNKEKKTLKGLEEKYEKLKAEGKENTSEAEKLAISINNQSAKVKKITKDIEKYSSSLDEMQSAGAKSRKELDNINKELEEQKQAAKDLGGGLLKGVGLGVAGIGAACVGAFGAINNIVEETKELRTQLGQIETTFTGAGHSVDNAKKTFEDLYGVLGDSGKATEASLHIGQLAKNEQELLQYTDILTGVYASFGDSLPVEGLAEAMNHTAKLGQVQGVLADALEWSGISVEDFNKELESKNTEEERAALINSTLSKLYGETSKKYKENNKDLIEANKAQHEYNETMAEIGAKAQPAITEFKLAMADALGQVVAKFNEVNISGFIDSISGAITLLVNKALPPLMKGITWTLDNLNWLGPLLLGIGGSVLAITSAIKVYTAVAKLAKVAQLAWNLALTANPIGIVIVAVTALVGAIALLWKKSEKFRNFFTGMWDTIKNASSKAVSFIKGAFDTTIGTIKGNINGVISFINGAINAINRISVKIPNWVPGDLGGKTLGFNLPTIPMLAQGGVVDKPTLAMIGEAGKEAVVPLENNTEWLNKLANMINAKQGANSTINNFNYTFEKMETTRHALHKAQIETKRLIRG